MTLQRTLRVTGQVQGVGFRPFVYRIANELGVYGAVWNDQRGVTIDAWAPAADLDVLQTRLKTDAPALACVDSVRCIEERRRSAHPPEGFTIRRSDGTTAERGRVTADSAVCPDCAAEMFEPSDRRFRHALINCTNCGPRYSIVRDLPYDRPRTTMAAFPMCPACRGEYVDPADRRFHAQPTCCPACGPRLALLDATGAQVPGDPIRAAAAVIAGGEVLAMKGLGGYHLVADAGNHDAVRTLRRRKRRDHKPLAVMVRSIERARTLVRLSHEAEALLRSPACPIVLAPLAAAAAPPRGICGLIAPDCHRLGIMLPYTPMQHLLLAETALHDAVLVMTSANLSDDPLISDDDDARGRLRDVCDAYLLHDRPIERAVDDSIVLDARFGVVPLRRARGFVPQPIELPVAAPRHGLCTGGELKNAVAVVRGAEAVLSQHIGDLTWALAHRRFRQTIEDLERLFDCSFAWVACDMHPAYTSHAYARRLAASANIDLVVVQHHHAHLASLLAEHGRTDRIIGLICDGVGYGDDGTAWGGEVLVGDLEGYERVARMRPLLLPGGDAAAKETGRCGISWLHDALGGDGIADHPLARRALADAEECAIVAGLLVSGRHCPPSSGMGRLFDAAASLLGVCDFNHYESMSGMRLESSAAASRRTPSGGDIVAAATNADGLLELDHRPLLLHLIEMMDAGVDTADVAWCFHDGLADGLVRAALRAAERTGIETIGMSGGVFCNELLTERVRARLAPGFDVLVHETVPPNDGGLALGQAAVAAATLANRRA